MDRQAIEMTGRAAVVAVTDAVFENATRAEDMPRTYNCLGRTIKNSCIIITTIMTVIIGVLIFIFLANFVWNMGGVHVENAGIRSAYADINITNGLLSFKANTSLLPTFRTVGGTSTPMLGQFTMGVADSKYRSIRSLCDSTFQTSGTEELVIVTCERIQVHLKEADILRLEKSLREEKVWIKVLGSFKWRLENKNPLIFKQTKGRARFGCLMPYHDLLRGECHPL